MDSGIAILDNPGEFDNRALAPEGEVPACPVSAANCRFVILAQSTHATSYPKAQSGGGKKCQDTTAFTDNSKWWWSDGPAGGGSTVNINAAAVRNFTGLSQIPFNYPEYDCEIALSGAAESADVWDQAYLSLSLVAMPDMVPIDGNQTLDTLKKDPTKWKSNSDWAYTYTVQGKTYGASCGAAGATGVAVAVEVTPGANATAQTSINFGQADGPSSPAEMIPGGYTNGTLQISTNVVPANFSNAFWSPDPTVNLSWSDDATPSCTVASSTTAGASVNVANKPDGAVGGSATLTTTTTCNKISKGNVNIPQHFLTLGGYAPAVGVKKNVAPGDNGSTSNSGSLGGFTDPTKVSGAIGLQKGYLGDSPSPASSLYSSAVISATKLDAKGVDAYFSISTNMHVSTTVGLTTNAVATLATGGCSLGLLGQASGVSNAVPAGNRCVVVTSDGTNLTTVTANPAF
jgi:hypothetical protein